MNEKIKKTERFYPDAAAGLDSSMVASRIKDGLVNVDSVPATKSVGRIIRDNLCTLFNLINAVIAAALIICGSYRNVLFMGVVLCNLFIGIVQEIRAKRAIDRLNLMSESKVRVVRGGALCAVAPDEVVLDEVMELRPGDQIVADSVILSGECDVDESFITGESEPVAHGEGDMLLSGSFIVSGRCRVRADRIASDSYIATVSSGAKYLKKPNSEIMETLKKIIKAISVIIIPVGLILLYNQFEVDGATVQSAVENTSAAIIGMMPNGLMVLTGTVLAVSVVRLSRHKVLCSELYCIETLARVDTLCLDKTGTITEGSMEVTDVIYLSDGDIAPALRGIVEASGDSNSTADAIRGRFAGDNGWRVSVSVPFSSRRKWSGATFDGCGSYVFGAAEFVLPDMDENMRGLIKKYAADSRVLMVAHSELPLEGDKLPAGLQPAALILLRDKIRPQAAGTLRYFADQGVDIKIISGDSADTVAAIAARVGLKNADNAVDMSGLAENEIDAAASRYTVFGRVTPEQKCRLVRALKAQGHTVAMTGDGVNDVLALRESDCSIAMASGTDAARNVSQLTLLDNNFDALPQVVAEGRRSINNIKRSASLFLIKTIYSTLMAVAFIFLPFSYPFVPIQLTLISVCTIGIPSFILALEPNHERVSGRFMTEVMMRAIPGAAAIIGSMVAVMVLSSVFGLSDGEYNTMCVIMAGFSGLLNLFKVCVPFNNIRRLLFAAMCGIFAVGVTLFGSVFSMETLGLTAALILPFIMCGAIALYGVMMIVFESALRKSKKRRA